MMVKLVNVLVLIVAGVMLANMIANPDGTKVFFDGIGNFWKISVNGMLAQPTK